MLLRGLSGRCRQYGSAGEHVGLLAGLASGADCEQVMSRGLERVLELEGDQTVEGF
jgi:hypothetical protein